MAKTTTLSARFVVNEDGQDIITAVGATSVTMAGTASQLTEQSIGTSTEALTMPDIDNVGYVFVKNTDATNFVRIGVVSPVGASDALITLLPGEFALFPSRLETIYAIADTGACVLRIGIAEL